MSSPPRQASGPISHVATTPGPQRRTCHCQHGARRRHRAHAHRNTRVADAGRAADGDRSGTGTCNGERRSRPVGLRGDRRPQPLQPRPKRNGGGRIQRISDDRVVIARAEGLLEVLLRDPSKPKAPAVTAAPTQQAPTGAPTPPPEVPSQVTPSAPVRARRSPTPLPAPSASGVPDSGGAPGGNRFYFPDTGRQ